MLDNNSPEKPANNNHNLETVWQKRDRESAERRNVDFEPLNKHPWAVSAIGGLINNVNGMLAVRGLQTVDVDLASIRFVDNHDWHNVIQTVTLPEDSDGFLDRDNNIIFLKTDRSVFGSDKRKKHGVFTL